MDMHSALTRCAREIRRGTFPVIRFRSRWNAVEARLYQVAFFFQLVDDKMSSGFEHWHITSLAVDVHNGGRDLSNGIFGEFSKFL